MKHFKLMSFSATIHAVIFQKPHFKFAPQLKVKLTIQTLTLELREWLMYS